MEQQTIRPSGLTVLAVLNFIFGGIQALGVLFSVASLGCTVTIAGVEQHPNITVHLLTMLLNAGTAATLIIAGVGCIKVHRLAGRVMVNIYFLLVVVRQIIRFAAPEAGSFTMFTIIGLLYPLLLFLFVNIVFRDLWIERTPVEPFSDQPHKLSREQKRPLPHAVLIGFNSVRQTLRSSAGIVLALAIMFIGLFTAQLLLLPLELFKNQPFLTGNNPDQEQVITRLESMAVPLIERILGNVTNEPRPAEGGGLFSPGTGSGMLQPFSPDLQEDTVEGRYSPRQWAYFLMRQRPGFLSLLYLLFCLVLPSVIIFSGFNQISEDARNRGLRYLLMRTRRRDIFLGKYLGSMMTTIILLLLLFICILLYIQFKLNLYNPGLLISWGLRGFLSFVLISLPFIAIAIVFSGMIDSGIGSLGATLGTLILVPFLFLALKNMWAPLLAFQYILPYKLSFYLFHPTWWATLLAGLAMAGYTALYLALGNLYFQKRDL
jgi:ABC-type transport system involved in multi-copper enzyme maturation permease subunit